MSILVYRGDGDEVRIFAQHGPSSGDTTLEWQSVLQPLELTGYDVYLGTIAEPGALNLATLSDATCVGTRVMQPGGAPGPTASTIDGSPDPAPTDVTYYIVGYAHQTAGGSSTLVGRQSDGTLRIEQSNCPQ